MASVPLLQDRAGLARGMDGYLAKPITAEELLRTLRMAGGTD